MAKKYFAQTITLTHAVMGRKEWRVDIEIDIDRLAWALGGRATRNKNKRTREMGGAIIADVRPAKSALNLPMP